MAVTDLGTHFSPGMAGPVLVWFEYNDASNRLDFVHWDKGENEAVRVRIRLWDDGGEGDPFLDATPPEVQDMRPVTGNHIMVPGEDGLEFPPGFAYSFEIEVTS